jgi:hypothetical protein
MVVNCVQVVENMGDVPRALLRRDLGLLTIGFYVGGIQKGWQI